MKSFIITIIFFNLSAAIGSEVYFCAENLQTKEIVCGNYTCSTLKSILAEYSDQLPEGFEAKIDDLCSREITTCQEVGGGVDTNYTQQPVGGGVDTSFTAEICPTDEEQA